jgi:Class II flagellar assembly regulator
MSLTALQDLKSPRCGRVRCGRRICRARQILPGRLRRINHNRTKLAHQPKGLAMRIYGPNGTTPGTAAVSARRSSTSAFALPDTAAALETRAASAPRAAANIDALLALQGIDDPLERRKRLVARGRGALDVLDDLKIGLLSGNFDTSTVSRLRDAAAGLKSTSGDPGLDAVLSEIELRVEVELAKAGQF